MSPLSKRQVFSVEKIRTSAILQWFISLLLLAPLIAFSYSVISWHGPFGKDASYYFNIADNVARGNGFTSNVSMYFEGLRLPARATIYPVWPVMLGLVGRFTGMYEAAAVLPRLLYFTDLVLLHVLAQRIIGRLRVPPQGIAAIALPYVVTALFATNFMFFWSTNQPYTEGLAFFFCLACFLALFRAIRPGAIPAWPWVAASSILSVLAFLTRSQMICVAASIGLVLAFAGLRDKPMRNAAILHVACFAMLVLPWSLYNGTIPGLGSMDPFAATPLKPMTHWVPFENPIHFLIDRASGLEEAFYPWSPYSYFSSFGMAVALAPMALLVQLHVWVENLQKGIHADTVISTIALASILFVLSLTMFHGAFFTPWLFGERHGLPFILALAVAIPYLCGRGRPAGLLIVAVSILTSLLAGSAQILDHQKQLRGKGPTEAEIELVQWLADHKSEHPVLLSSQAQVLGAYSGANFHWALCEEPPARTREMLLRLPIDYVVVYRSEESCPYLEGIQSRLNLIATFGAHDRVPIYVYGKSG